MLISFWITIAVTRCLSSELSFWWKFDTELHDNLISDDTCCVNCEKELVCVTCVLDQWFPEQSGNHAELKKKEAAFNLRHIRIPSKERGVGLSTRIVHWRIFMRIWISFPSIFFSCWLCEATRAVPGSPMHLGTGLHLLKRDVNYFFMGKHYLCGDMIFNTI